MCKYVLFSQCLSDCHTKCPIIAQVHITSILLHWHNSKLKEFKLSILFFLFASWRWWGKGNMLQVANIVLFFTKHLMICGCLSSLFSSFDENGNKSFKFCFSIHITQNQTVPLKSLQLSEYGSKRCLSL